MFQLSWQTAPEYTVFCRQFVRELGTGSFNSANHIQVSMSRMLLALLVIVLQVGCATPKYNYTPNSIAISEPPIGSVTVVRIGDTMLRQGKYREHEALHLSAIREISWAYTLHPG